MNKLSFFFPVLVVGFLIIPFNNLSAQLCTKGGAIGTNNGQPCCLDVGPKACGGPDECPACPSVPLDGGLSALLIAGIAYGSKKAFGKSK
jgi:hypothetical protein